MSRKIAGFLVGLAVFMVVEWVNLGFNLADGHKTSFYVVHGILIAVNIALAAVLGVIGWRGLRTRSLQGISRTGRGGSGGAVRPPARGSRRSR